ncbi:MAG: M48 family metallopeptidase [Bacteroidetes bacterium]|nr:M48 family metallopeptidase [Bacteroidota bacterium]
MDINYTVKYSNRKTLAIIVERDKSILVRAPKDYDENKIEKAVNKKRFWLYQKLNHSQKYSDFRSPREFVSGESFLYLGKRYNLDIVEKEINGIYFSNKFEISKSSQSNASDLFIKWYRQKAKELIIPKVEEYAKNLGVKYDRIFIKDLKFRWGSCSPKKNLNFNWRLIKAPINVLNYVIVHELAHLIEPNHNDDFWNIIKIQIPKYIKAKEWLKENGELLEWDI